MTALPPEKLPTKRSRKRQKNYRPLLGFGWGPGGKTFRRSLAAFFQQLDRLVLKGANLRIGVSVDFLLNLYEFVFVKC